MRNHAQIADGSTKNGAKLILAEVEREHGQAVVDPLIRELDLETIFDFKPGTVFRGLTSG